MSLIHHATPILRVKDLDASIAYYTQSLGFKINWRAPNADFAGISRHTCTLFLTMSDQGHPGTWLWIAAEDTEALRTEWLTTGALIRQPPTNFPWGSLEMQVTDPDGHILRFASDAIPGKPFGPWMDAEGKLWPIDS